MSRQTTVLQIFLASPSDVSQEREIVGIVVAELNKTWSETLGITYDVVKWETDVVPGFSSEPQAVINEHIPSDYDVFIGIFWGRVGTPTNNHASGSIEEFEIAYQRHLSTGAPEIMVYFKEAPIPPSKIDPAQIGSLQDFKKKLGALGGLYSTFEDNPSLEASLRSHLTAVARKFLSKPQQIEIAPTESLEASEDSEDLGYLDYVDIYTYEIGTMVSSLGLITKLIVSLGAQMSKRAEQIKSATAQLKRVFLHRSADDMESFCVKLGDQLVVYKFSKDRALDALSQAVVLHAEIAGKNDAMVKLRGSLQGQIEAIAGAKLQLIGMRDKVDGIPRMTKEINRAKNSMAVSLDHFISEVDSTFRTFSNIAESIDQMV